MENNKNGLEFTEPENKIRKKWLFLSTLLPTFFLGAFIIIFCARLFISADFMVIANIVLFSAISIGWLYMNYHCAYKNPGTILLLITIVVSLFNLIFASYRTLVHFILIFTIYYGNFHMMKASQGLLLFFLVLMLLWDVSVLFYSYKLRKINKKMQKKILAASPAYISAMSIFSTATNLEELNEQFTKLQTSHGSGSSVEILAKAYGEQKKLLL